MCTDLNCNIVQTLCEEVTQGAPALSPQSIFPPVCRQWPSRKIFLLQTIPSHLLHPLARWQTRGAALQLGGYFMSPFSYCSRLSACTHKDHSQHVPGWAPRYACILSFGGILAGSFNCRTIIHFPSSFVVMLLFPFACEVSPAALKGLFTLSSSTHVLPWVGKVPEEKHL